MIIRDAVEADCLAIVRMLADDQIGATCEDPSEPLQEAYRQSFAEIQASPDNRMMVVEIDGAVVGCLQLTVVPGMSHMGARRGNVESVRVASHLRGRGIGEALLRHAAEEARRAGCRTLELTTNAVRVDARRFYERIGFKASHIGMKLPL